jgi:hypothetical protein
MEKSQSHIDKNPSEREKQKTGKLPNVTDIMEKSQSNIDKNPSEGGKTEKTEKKRNIYHLAQVVVGHSVRFGGGTVSIQCTRHRQRLATHRVLLPGTGFLRQGHQHWITSTIEMSVKHARKKMTRINATPHVLYKHVFVYFDQYPKLHNEYHQQVPQ